MFGYGGFESVLKVVNAEGGREAQVQILWFGSVNYSIDISIRGFVVALRAKYLRNFTF